MTSWLATWLALCEIGAVHSVVADESGLALVYLCLALGMLLEDYRQRRWPTG